MSRRGEVAETLLMGLSPDDARRLGARVTDETDGDTDKACAAAWLMGVQTALNRVSGLHTCRICGCWQGEACEGGCSWVEPDLCSACVEPDQNADQPRCIACDRRFKVGDRYYPDVSGGFLHAECTGPEREGFCDLESGEPLAEGEPIPEPSIWTAD